MKKTYTHKEVEKIRELHKFKVASLKDEIDLQKLKFDRLVESLRGLLTEI